jgi:hypothetical protein
MEEVVGSIPTRSTIQNQLLAATFSPPSEAVVPAVVRVVSVEVTPHGNSMELGVPPILFPTQPAGPAVFETSVNGDHLCQQKHR